MQLNEKEGNEIILVISQVKKCVQQKTFFFFVFRKRKNKTQQTHKRQNKKHAWPLIHNKS